MTIWELFSPEEQKCFPPLAAYLFQGVYWVQSSLAPTLPVTEGLRLGHGRQTELFRQLQEDNPLLSYLGKQSEVVIIDG